MRNLLLSTLCAVLIGSAPAMAQSGSNSRAALRGYFTGNGLLNRGMYDHAAAEYRKFLREYPDSDKAPMARYGLAVCLFRTGEFQQTIDTLNELEPPDDFEYPVEVLMMLGQSRLTLGNPGEAASVFDQVVRDHLDHELADEAAALQVEALYEAGRYDQVERPCKLLDARWPQSPQRQRAELFRGLAEMARAEYPQAAARFEAMLQQYPGGTHADRAALLLAQSLHHAGDDEGASIHYTDVIQTGRDEFVPDAMYGLAVLLHRGGDLEGAGKLLDQMIAQYADRGDGVATAALLLRGRVWFDVESYDRALEQFERLAATGGAAFQDDAAYWSAKCALRRGEHERAAQELALSLERYPGSDLLPQMTYDRAVALLRSDDAESAIEVLGEFRARYKDHELSGDALELMAAAHHQQRRYGESLALCREFEEQYAGTGLSRDVAFLTAENTYLLGDYETAGTLYTTLLDRWPDHRQADQARYRLGMALHQQSRYEQAEPWLAQVAQGRETAPEYRPALLALGDGHFQRGHWPDAEQDLADYLSFGTEQASVDDALLKLGLAQQRQDQHRTALGTFRQLLDEFDQTPHRVHALFESGQVLIELDSPDEAAVAFEQVLAEGPESAFAPHAMNHLGAIALANGNDVEAATWFGRAAQSATDDELAAEALFQEGQALMAARQFEQAAPVLDRFNQAYPLHERRPEASALHAIALSRRGAASDAESQEQALAAIEFVEGDHLPELEPSLRASLWYEKAWCLRSLGRSAEAAQAYRSVIDQNSAEPIENHALLELAELEFESERHGEAAKLLRRIQRNASSETVSPSLRRQCTYRLGLCEFHLGNHQRASELLETWLDDEPEPQIVPSARLLCAEALIHTGHPRQAVEHLTHVIREYPDDKACETAMLRLGESYASLQDWTRSEETFAAYLERWQDSELWFQAQFGIGWARENQGRYDDAVQSYEIVVDRHQGPSAARAQFQIGECLFAQQKYDEAVSELLKVDILYAYPEWSAAALYEAGRCFQEVGNPVDARKQYEQVQRQHAQTKWAGLAAKRLAEIDARTLPGR